jgi:hydrogenase maturation protein HypF
VAFDGTGFGPDGTIWGGEFLTASALGYERMGHLSPAPLVGGDSAIRFPKRTALGYLAAAAIPWDFDIPAVAAATEPELRVLRRQIATGLNVVMTTSAGRLFDAVASILGLRHEAGYEAEPAMVLETVAGRLGEPYPIPVPTKTPFVVPIRPILAAIVTDLARGFPVSDIAARFHGTMVRAVTTGCQAIRATTGLGVVALGGGSFQNAHLLTGARAELERAGFTVLVPEQVPPNDGGIALGQAWIGRERLRLNGADG